MQTKIKENFEMTFIQAVEQNACKFMYQFICLEILVD